MMERKEPDQWGYTRYAVVLFVPEEGRRKVDAVRAQLPIPVAMIPAHVTVKGSFDSPKDLDEVRRRVREVAGRTRPFDVELLDILVGMSGAGPRAGRTCPAWASSPSGQGTGPTP